MVVVATQGQPVPRKTWEYNVPIEVMDLGVIHTRQLISCVLCFGHNGGDDHRRMLQLDSTGERMRVR